MARIVTGSEPPRERSGAVANDDKSEHQLARICKIYDSRPPRQNRRRTKLRLHRSYPLMLMSIISSQSSTRRSSRGETGIMPALLTRTSSLPYRSHANSTGWIRRRAVLRLSVDGRPHHPHPRYESPEQLSSYDIRRHESSHHLAADNPSRGARFYFTLPSD